MDDPGKPGRKNGGAVTENELKMEKARSKITASGGFWGRMQRCVAQGKDRIAAAVYGRFNRLSSRSQKVVLMLFCLVCVTASGSVMFHSLVRKPAPGLHIDHIRQPAIHPPSQSLPVLSPVEYERLHAYRLYLDSLSNTGDTLRKSQRDTLLYLESIYEQQLNNTRHEKQ